MEVIDEQQDLDHILLNILDLKGGDLSSHLGLKQLHKDCQKVLVILGVGCELGHHFSRKNYSTLAQSVLDFRAYLEMRLTIHTIEGKVAQVDEASDLELSKEAID